MGHTPKVYVDVFGHASPKPSPRNALFQLLNHFILHMEKNMTEVSSSLQAFECLRAQINPYAEELWLIALNSQMEAIKKEMVFRGTADHCLIHPRDIFRILILCNASSFIMAHNHPSDQVLPSEQDLVLTRKIHQLATLFQIPLNDHIIMTTSQYYSMADQGYFKKWKKSSDKYLY